MSINFNPNNPSGSSPYEISEESKTDSTPPNVESQHTSMQPPLINPELKHFYPSPNVELKSILSSIQNDPNITDKKLSNVLNTIHKQFRLSETPEEKLKVIDFLREEIKKQENDEIKFMLRSALSTYVNTPEEAYTLLEENKSFESSFPILKAYYLWTYSLFLSKSNNLQNLHLAKQLLQKAKETSKELLICNLIINLELSLALKIDTITAIQFIQENPNITDENLSNTLRQLTECFRRSISLSSDEALKIKHILTTTIKEEKTSDTTKAVLSLFLSVHSSTPEERDNFLNMGLNFSLNLPTFQAYSLYAQAIAKSKNNPKLLTPIIELLDQADKKLLENSPFFIRELVTNTLAIFVEKVEAFPKIILQVEDIMQFIQNDTDITDKKLSDTLEKLTDCFKEAISLNKESKIKELLIKKAETTPIVDIVKSMLYFLLSTYCHTSGEIENFLQKGEAHKKGPFLFIEAYALYAHALSLIQKKVHTKANLVLAKTYLNKSKEMLPEGSWLLASIKAAMQKATITSVRMEEVKNYVKNQT